MNPVCSQINISVKLFIEVIRLKSLDSCVIPKSNDFGIGIFSSCLEIPPS